MLPLTSGTASADTSPPPGDPANPPTVSADALPTVQIDGVVWDQEVVGNTVYVGGDFEFARPAGAPPGVNTAPRSNLLAYDIRTGQLITAWAPSANGAVLSIEVAPDRSRLYVGGSFTNVNGVIKNRIAALNLTNGALVGSFRASADATVRAMVATRSAVYFGGLITAVNNVTRSRVAAVSASDGSLLAWRPQATGGSVRGMAMSPDGSIVVGGSFTQMNGSSNPGYGLARLDPVTGGNLTLPANTVVRNATTSAAITDVAADGDSVYVSGYTYSGTGGNLEGTARMDAQGNLVWIEDCHGDTYNVFPVGDVVYKVGHAHHCGNLVGGFPQTEPWSFFNALAFSKVRTGSLKDEYLGYANFAGQPAPDLLTWMPRLDTGGFTGQNQAAWDLEGTADYVVAGGEFPRAGNTAQQGLVRFARPGLAPLDAGPVWSGARTVPTVTSRAAGQALVVWEANWDRDNENLTYRVIRNGVIGSPAHTVTVPSAEWNRRYLSFLDRGLTPGATVRYRIFATDPDGNESRSDTVSVVVAGQGTMDAYAEAVTRDGPMHYWRLDEASGTTMSDYTGLDSGTLSGTVVRDRPGALTTSSSTQFAGGSGANSVARRAPSTFSVEALINTTTTTGGKIVGYGGARTGSSSSTQHDRQVYMSNNGRLNFGVRLNGQYRVVTPSRAYNDGRWHHVVGVVSDDGMSLFVDGQQVAHRADVRTGGAYTGYWRVGSDTIATGWPNRPTSAAFAGRIDEVAVYRHALTGAQVSAHYAAAIAAPRSPGVLAEDAFGRSVAGGWGSAPTGGPWSLSGGSRLFRVDGARAAMSMATAGAGPRGYLSGVSARDVDAHVRFGLAKRGNGGGTFVSLGARATNSNTGYRAKVKVAANGRVSLYVGTMVNGAETTISRALLPSATTHAVGDALNVRMQTRGASPTTVRAKVWEQGATEPAGWQVTGINSSTALQGAGGIALVGYLSGSATNAPVTALFDDLRVERLP